MKEPLVSIVIVNWNGKKLLMDCINSLSKISYKNYELVISDNGSVDGSIEYINNLKKKGKKIVLVENGKNLGFADGNNTGVKKANGELILFLNNDTFLDKNFLSILVDDLLNHPEYAAVQPKILSYPNKSTVDSAGSFFLNTGFLYHFGHNKKDQKKYDVPHEIFSMKGACMLFRKKVLDKTGVFDGDYFAYFEETDLCIRTLLSGFKLGYTPKSKIYHIGGATSKNLVSSFVQYNSYKNRIYTYLKDFEIHTLLRIMPLHLLMCEIISGVYILKGQFGLSFCIQRAIFWNLRNYKKLLKDRKKIKKMRKVSDSEFIPSLTRNAGPSYYYHLLTTSLAGYKD